MYSEGVVLSVVIISHNQRELLRRCIDSVLAQQTSFPVQVIVSDDRSTDGTREMLLAEYGDRVFSTFCNSDECNPDITLERASFNRLNGLKYATGKYLMHVDGDDFYTSTDLFQEMVDTLEAHPECTMCCQNFYWVEDGKLNEHHSPANTSNLLTKNGVIRGEELCTNLGFVHNSCFCMRRNAEWTFEDLNGIPYDDCTITARYLGKGDIAVLNRCDFVYVQYDHSSFTSVSDENKRILFQPGVLRIKLIPSLAGVSLKSNVGIISYISDKALHELSIPESYVKHFSKMPLFLFAHLSNDISFVDKIRYLMINLLTVFLQWSKSDSKLFYKLLYRLAIGKITPEVVF